MEPSPSSGLLVARICLTGDGPTWINRRSPVPHAFACACEHVRPSPVIPSNESVQSRRYSRRRPHGCVPRSTPSPVPFRPRSARLAQNHTSRVCPSLLYIRVDDSDAVSGASRNDTVSHSPILFSPLRNARYETPHNQYYCGSSSSQMK